MRGGGFPYLGNKKANAICCYHNHTKQTNKTLQSVILSLLVITIWDMIAAPKVLLQAQVWKEKLKFICSRKPTIYTFSFSIHFTEHLLSGGGKKYHRKQLLREWNSQKFPQSSIREKELEASFSHQRREATAQESSWGSSGAGEGGGKWVAGQTAQCSCKSRSRGSERTL